MNASGSDLSISTDDHRDNAVTVADIGEVVDVHRALDEGRAPTKDGAPDR